MNIAELLKDCPKGMELYSPIFGEVYLSKIRPHLAIVVTTDKEQGNVKEEFLYDGRYGMNGECMLFPSKGKTTWEGFQRPFKDGDIVTYEYENGLVSMILKKFVNFVEVHHHCALYDNAKGFVTNNYIVGEPKYTRFATEEQKEKLFDTIKANGYKWNPETKTLEKFIEPKFKVGDRIKEGKTIATVVRVCKDVYDIRLDSGGIGAFTINLQDRWELVPNKFDISSLKPFDRVLVRSDNKHRWSIQLFERLNTVLKDTFVCMGDRWEWDRRAIYESKLFDEDLYELYQELRRSEE